MVRQPPHQRADTEKVMSKHLAAILIFVFALLQTTLLGRVSPFGLKPELLLILACFFLLYLPAGEALVAVFVLGLICDAYSLAPFGLNALSFMLMAALLLRAREELAEANLLTWCVVLGGATLLNGLLHLMVLRLVLWEPVPGLDFLGRLLLLVLINVLLGAGLFPLLRHLGDGSAGSPGGGWKGRREDMSLRKAL